MAAPADSAVTTSIDATASACCHRPRRRPHRHPQPRHHHPHHRPRPRRHCPRCRPGRCPWPCHHLRLTPKALRLATNLTSILPLALRRGCICMGLLLWRLHHASTKSSYASPTPIQNILEALQEKMAGPRYATLLCLAVPFPCPTCSSYIAAD